MKGLIVGVSFLVANFAQAGIHCEIRIDTCTEEFCFLDISNPTSVFLERGEDNYTLKHKVKSLNTEHVLSSSRRLPSQDEVNKLRTKIWNSNSFYSVDFRTKDFHTSGDYSIQISTVDSEMSFRMLGFRNSGFKGIIAD
jgi:hypothetical protein